MDRDSAGHECRVARPELEWCIDAGAQVEPGSPGERVVDARATLLLDWLRETLPARPQWRAVPFIDYGRANLTDLSYFVGAMFFDLLYRLVGRETFNTIIREYVADFSSSGGST